MATGDLATDAPWACLSRSNAPRVPDCVSAEPPGALQSVCGMPWLGPHRVYMMFTARAMTRVARVKEIRASPIIIIFAHRLIAETSVGPKAVAVLNDSAR